MKRILATLLGCSALFGGMRTDVFGQDARNRDGGANRFLPPSGSAQLGVRVSNREFGVEVVQVIPGSPASQVGLERADVIITVGGYQVGYVNGRLYDVGEECNRRVDANGMVRLVIRNARTGFLANVDVNLGAPIPPGPIPPGPFPPPNPGWGQGLISGTIECSTAVQLPAGSALHIRLLEEGFAGTPATPVAQTTHPNIPGFPAKYHLNFRPANISPKRRYYLDARVLQGGQVLCQTNQPYWYTGGARPQMNMVVTPVAPPPPDQGPVALITQWYRIYLGREPDQLGLQGQLAALQQGQTVGDIQAAILSSGEFFDRCNNNAHIWISQVYSLALNQKPKPSDIDYWVERIRYHKGNRLITVRELLKAAS